jgi:hypothetical protein|tara:strand:+ start:2520 stop:2723 length:204 start_codon:yes stop_codon:yes gene_type:complete
MHKFVIMKNNELFTYTNFEDIPSDFDHMIEFLPEIPPEPHTEEQHQEIQQWNGKLQQLMEIERARSL